ncbi:efflux transporter outer membrane subunit [Salinisphaera hydrothermalis]|uniref:RND efflux system outer membrane lipoprotein n=1 Tax=Salinisphaera hydrothermalis (strain C41B8) TaxID=1304275 RepID=A0A084IN45_SALHC|nr:efflux transporter outer membrane subunit [Salinisphaera hydrothermalis]KEZ78129.1 RND efflux system outer membrane lipoprotein [Salinisphaera hydrothermalis C41B8]
MRTVLLTRSRAQRPALTAAFMLITLITGCTVGPDYHPPAAPASNAYDINGSTTGDENAEASDSRESIPKQAFERASKVRADWYKVFGSDKLDALIGRAIQHSPTLAAGRARIKAAREVVKENKAALYPQIGVNGGYSRNRVTGAQFGITQSSFTNVFNLYQAQATASYDLDLFGKTRRMIEASNAQLDEQQYQVINTYVTLINNVVATAITEAGLNAAIETTRDIAKSQADALAIVRKQIKYGAAIDADATQIQTQLARTRASLEPLLKQKTLAVNRLAVLVGSNPGDFSDPDFTLDQLRLPHKLPVSVPGQLVEQRPDILAAAAAVHAASARIGVATANLLPDISISGSYSRSALTPSDLGDPAFALYSLGASLSAPLFEGGRLHAAKRQAQDLFVAALSDYRATTLSAFGEVANSLRSIESDARALEAQRTALRAARNNLQTVRTQLKNGAADYVNLYTAQAQYQSAELDYTEARVTRYRDTADLFRALGGGWAKGDRMPTARTTDASRHSDSANAHTD